MSAFLQTWEIGHGSHLRRLPFLFMCLNSQFPGFFCLCFSFKMFQYSINYGCSLVSASELICKHSFSSLGHKCFSYGMNILRKYSPSPQLHIIWRKTFGTLTIWYYYWCPWVRWRPSPGHFVKYCLSSDFNTLGFESVSFYFILFAIIFSLLHYSSISIFQCFSCPWGKLSPSGTI